MASGLSTMPTPIYSIQQHRFTRQDGWRLDDISLCSSGNIAVSGGNDNDRRTFVCIYSTVDNSDSRDKPTLLYEKEFEKYSEYWYDRYISFIKPNSTEIVTCVKDNVTVLDYNRDVVLRSRKVNGYTTCLSVSESQIFIGLRWSYIVYIYDIDLNEIKSIKLKEMGEEWPRDWPIDISAVADRLYVRTQRYGRAIVYSQTSGSILTEYTTVQDDSNARSITQSVQLDVAVLLNQDQIIFYLLSENKSFLTVNVDDGVSRIRISDQGRIVTGNEITGEVKIYDLKTNIKEESQLIESDPDFHQLLGTEATITKSGGIIQIPNTGVVLLVPPNALPKEMKQCMIKMKIIPNRMVEDREASFASNSSVVVELIPDNIRLQRPVRLSLPHCLVLHEKRERKARIFVSHHKEGSPPLWKEQTQLSYHLEDTTCVILLNSFCWVKYAVDGEIVEAKKILVYAAAKKLLPQDNVATIEVGYYPDLPGRESEVLRLTRSLTVLHKKTFFFWKTKECYPLKLSLDKIFPKEWNCFPADMHPKEIPFTKIASSCEHSFTYHFQKRGKADGNLLCVFTISQIGGHIPIHLAAYPQATCMNSLLTSGMELHRKVTNGHAVLQIEAGDTRTHAELHIPDTDVVLEIPPDALPVDMHGCAIHLRIMPTRTVQDKVTSFSSNSSVAVEFLADDLELQHPIKLKLPHCLELREDAERKVKIFKKDMKERQSQWEEQPNLKYCLEDNFCSIWIDKPCCVKYSVHDEIVMGKKIVVYTAARKDIPTDVIGGVEVGYYPDMPGGGELLRLNPNLIVDYKKILYYKERQGFPLQLSLDHTLPFKLKRFFPNENPQEIPFKMIAWSIEHSHLYILQKTNKKADTLVCKFTATQQEGDLPVDLEVRMFQQQERQPQGTVQTGQQMTNAEPMAVTFQFLSQKLGSNWRFVGRKLGLEDADLEHIKEDYTGMQEQIYQMLVRWKRKNGTNATHANLIQSLENAQRKDLAEDVKNRKDQEVLAMPGSYSGERT